MVKVLRLLGAALLVAGLLGGCSYLPALKTSSSAEEQKLAEAREALASAKTEHDRKPDAETERKFDLAQRQLETKTLEAVDLHRQAGQWYQATALLDQSLTQLPDSARLQKAKLEIESTRQERLARNDCRLGAARARYLADKSDLLKVRAPLEAKDYLQDWLSRRERNELDQLGEQLRECAEQALQTRELGLAEETIAAAGRARGAEFIETQRKQLADLRKPPKQAVQARAEPKPPAENPQRKIRKQRAILQSAMTRGNLKQAKLALKELRRLEGDTKQLKELSESIDEAIAAYIADANERASAHYRDRQIEQARDLWKEILELDPNDSQARANLERAERVLKKLEELQGTSPEAAADAKPVNPVPSQSPPPTP